MSEYLNIFLIKILNIYIFLYETFIHQNQIINTIKEHKIKFNKIIDIGSHNGIYIKKFLKVSKNASIYAFEPQDYFYNKILNKFPQNNVKLFNLALGNTDSIKNIKIPSITSTMSLSEINKDSRHNRLKKKFFESSLNNNYQKIKIKKLDEILPENQDFDIIKIDVEGYELNVIKGGINTIKNSKLLIVEEQRSKQYENNYYQIDEILKKNNFKLIKKLNFFLLNFSDNIYINQKPNTNKSPF